MNDNTSIAMPKGYEYSVGPSTPPPPTISITANDYRPLLTIHPDGTVTGEIEDASEAARLFVESLRGYLPRPTQSDALREAEILEAAIDRMGWVEINAYRAELRKGQDISEDAGGFMLRALKALFGIKPIDPVVNYQNAARALVAAALQEQSK